MPRYDESTYSDPQSRYPDSERCEWDTTKGERCKRAWMVRRSDTDPTKVCWPHREKPTRLV